jgi:hypothetical protein
MKSLIRKIRKKFYLCKSLSEGKLYPTFNDNESYNQLYDMSVNGDLTSEEAIEIFYNLDCIFVSFNKTNSLEVGYLKKGCGLSINLFKK